jgi:hypothetical protein
MHDDVRRIESYDESLSVLSLVVDREMVSEYFIDVGARGGARQAICENQLLEWVQRSRRDGEEAD